MATILIGEDPSVDLAIDHRGRPTLKGFYYELIMLGGSKKGVYAVLSGPFTNSDLTAPVSDEMILSIISNG